MDFEKNSKNVGKTPGVRNMRTKSGIIQKSAIGSDFGPKILAESQHWAVVWARIVALSWENASFRNALVHAADPKTVIYNWLNYQVNPQLDLKIMTDPTHTQYTGPGKPVGTGPGRLIPDTWKGFPNHQLILYLPDPPADQNLWPIALAEFTDTGRTYPFTSL
jgi:ribosomally synthesized peptide (two-chain TOMM family)